ncbi:MAG TPA: hypothetical protein VIT92_07565 [Burkholderiaceae bacterium]
MTQSTSNTPGKDKPPYRNMLDEADIGSGERTPGQKDTDRIVNQINADGEHDLPPDPQGEHVGTRRDLVDQLADSGLSADDDQPLPGQIRRRTVEDDESEAEDGLMQGQQPFPPKGN